MADDEIVEIAEENTPAEQPAEEASAGEEKESKTLLSGDEGEGEGLSEGDSGETEFAENGSTKFAEIGETDKPHNGIISEGALKQAMAVQEQELFEAAADSLRQAI